MPVWRLGYQEAPCEFPPHHLYAWTHRFDDPRREYRTLYCADDKRTCLREVLADLRPKITALSEYEKLFGSGGPELNAVGTVHREWRRKHVLVQAEIEIQAGALVDVESADVREHLEGRLSTFLRKESVGRLDIRRLRGKNRRITGRISRTLYDDGQAGLKFRSHLDACACYVLFEFRAGLYQIGGAIALSNDNPDLLAVCAEFGLRLSW